ncbi:MAG: putative toxin-antitoxin system toxin component, PIN family [Draconibacterium sp.]|nr:putative toxin-antitoxin system toxin component, PIN family [Draconibacterium sp.]
MILFLALKERKIIAQGIALCKIATQKLAPRSSFNKAKIYFGATCAKQQYYRDLKDNFFLNLAIDGKADYLVTGDTDLLVMEKIQNTEIIAFVDLFDRLK